MNPASDGNCQFAAIKHKPTTWNLQGWSAAVDHLRKNRCFYEQFIHGSSFDDYLTHMSQDGSYGDNLTLMAIMREYNMQCYVVSAAGADHSALVSNDGVYDSNLPLITIAEDKGMHYLSVSVDVDLLRWINWRHCFSYARTRTLNRTRERPRILISCEPSVQHW